ncbi:DUF922 domain-containing protein [Aureitalea sp. L0-47]|uniref:DUF922 domain-containing protein n=1 Tax=Aureitalea sp. L0-47 TaxID=2816962 RepID=UPI00223855BE|nr:DUF922 domain-containing protein [Aureitalea sp. L0-47]MCW5520303.1 DUF922 domain-containing protein [Aureitalea sp. L0-47]
MKFLFAIVLGAFFLITPANDKEKFHWDQNRPLNWTDFRGSPEGPQDFVASTNSGISLSYSIGKQDGRYTFDYSVHSNFYPKDSWYRPESASEYILKHEQTHFDISELHARKLRKALAGLRVTSSVKSDADEIYRQTERERRDMQQAYDDDSDHSKIRDAEMQWRLFVASELEKYAAWE